MPIDSRPDIGDVPPDWPALVAAWRDAVADFRALDARRDRARAGRVDVLDRYEDLLARFRHLPEDRRDEAAAATDPDLAEARRGALAGAKADRDGVDALAREADAALRHALATLGRHLAARSLSVDPDLPALAFSAAYAVGRHVRARDLDGKRLDVDPDGAFCLGVLGAVAGAKGLPTRRAGWAASLLATLRAQVTYLGVTAGDDGLAMLSGLHPDDAAWSSDGLGRHAGVLALDVDDVHRVVAAVRAAPGDFRDARVAVRDAGLCRGRLPDVVDAGTLAGLADADLQGEALRLAWLSRRARRVDPAVSAAAAAVEAETLSRRPGPGPAP